MELSGNTILVTGGASGIGLALAEALLARDNTVIVCGRSADKLAAAKGKLPSLHTRTCDLTDAASRSRLHAELVREFPALDVIVHNAGVMSKLDLTSMGAEEAARIAQQEVETNLMAPIHLSLLFIPHLMAKRRAAIINISTGLVYTPAAPNLFYSASKAGLHSFTQSLRAQLAGTSIRVHEVLPPVVETDMSREFNASKMKPEAFVAAVLRGLRADREEVRVGQTAALYWLSRVWPGLAFKIVNRAAAGD